MCDAGPGLRPLPSITLAVDDWLLEWLLTFYACSEDLEDNGDGEPDDDAEGMGRPIDPSSGREARAALPSPAPIAQRPSK